MFLVTSYNMFNIGVHLHIKSVYKVVTMCV